MKRPVPEPFAHGASQRKQISRTNLGHWDPALRKQDPFAILQKSLQGRVPVLLPLKVSRMSVSAFGFFRGAAPIMAYDLSLSPHTGILTQLCGDAHLANLGAYDGPDGRLIFDINDFDETIRGPFEWDVKRMATSILLAGNSPVKHADRHRAVTAFLAAYCELTHCLSLLPILEAARFQVHRLDAVTALSDIFRKAERSTPIHLRDQLIEATKTAGVFRSQRPTLWRVEGKERAAVLASLTHYRANLLPERQHFFAQFRPIDVGFKVVGTGSVGLRDYVVYLEGNGPKDPLFLQIKEEAASTYATYLPAKASPQAHNGQRVADGQRAMQLQSDPLLGWTTIDRRHFLVRQLNDHKAALDPTCLDAEGLLQYAKVCGEMLARGHARSGDARIIAGYIGHGKPFHQAILTFAEDYAKQTIRDWKAYKAQQPRPH